MPVSAALAIDALNGVARDGKLPWWGTPEGKWDMHHFVETTRGHAVVMGRATWEMLRKPLAGRLNLVLTRNPAFIAEGATVVHTPDEAVAVARRNDKELWVIGGPSTYDAFLPLITAWVVTRFTKSYRCTLYYTPRIGKNNTVTKVVTFPGGKVLYMSIT